MVKECVWVGGQTVEMIPVGGGLKLKKRRCCFSNVVDVPDGITVIALPTLRKKPCARNYSCVNSKHDQ